MTAILKDKRRKQGFTKNYWPTVVFAVYSLLVIAEIAIFYGIMGLEWGYSDPFFAELGVMGSILWRPIALAWLLAINPLILSLQLVECGSGFISLCLPSLAGTVLNLLIIFAVIFILNFLTVKFIRKRQTRI